MPNHVINEVRFTGLNAVQRATVLAKVRGGEGEIDFGTLLPVPLNAWNGSASALHEKAFPVVALDWCTENWSTKWNAYGLNEDGRYRSTVEGKDGSLTLTFRTAWGPPMGWLVALFNATALPFEYAYFSEGGAPSRVGKFHFATERSDSMQWSERDATGPEHRHLHKLLWGVEQFEDEEEEPSP